MKLTKLPFTLLLITTILISSCGSDDEAISESSCSEPTNLSIVEYNNASQVKLAWDADTTSESSYTIEYGLEGFTLGTGDVEITTENMITISSLNFNAAYDFYLNRVCLDGTSAFVGPVTNGPDSGTASFALMTANIAGEQFNDMKPFLYGITDATRVVTFSSSNENFLAIQGNSAYTNTNLENTKEINLFIPESQWSPGTYALKSDPTSGGNAVSNVNIIYNDSSTPSTQAYEEEDGRITITNFNTNERIIEGTFEFRFKLYYVDSNTYSDILQCQNGTFRYALDASYFD
ncbi:MAG: DUF6252 family protein [Patiriisocius sp.]|uniref:DUF6252 family protein n=1 Tax=Patiriisocius sp. TaxID=2822396 RepID=UPI003EF3F536